MDTATKLKEMIREARVEAARQLRLADDLTEALKRATNGSEHVQVIRPRLNSKSVAEPMSTLRTAVALLNEQQQPMHINELVNEVSKMRGKLTPRTSLESVLAVAIKQKKFGLKRTAPGTFEVEK